MKYRLIDTPGFPVKKASELKEGEGDVVYVYGDGAIWLSSDESEYSGAKNLDTNPSGLVGRAFEVVPDEWTWSEFNQWTYEVHQGLEYRAHFVTEQAAREYCDWKNGK